MKPNEITISAYLSVEGEQWLLHLKAEIEAEDYVALARHTSDMVSKLKKAGFRTFSQGKPNHLPPAKPAVTGTQGAASFTWPAPVCPVHDRDMIVSKYQKDEGLIYHYCPSKVDTGGFCKQCASVSETSGSPNYYEVKP